MKSFIYFIIFIFSVNVFSSTSLELLFVESFHTHYKSGRCGDNILELVRRAREAEISLEGARILEIQNKGNSVFGLVNAEYAREAGRFDPSGPSTKPYRYFPGEKNWYHHVVLEFEGEIYDFDYGNSPQVVPVKKYFDVMFLIEKKESEGGSFYLGAETKLKEYQITSRDALATLKARELKIEAPEVQGQRFKDFLLSY